MLCPGSIARNNLIQASIWHHQCVMVQTDVFCSQHIITRDKLNVLYLVCVMYSLRLACAFADQSLRFYIHGYITCWSYSYLCLHACPCRSVSTLFISVIRHVLMRWDSCVELMDSDLTLFSTLSRCLVRDRCHSESRDIRPESWVRIEQNKR